MGYSPGGAKSWTGLGDRTTNVSSSGTHELQTQEVETGVTRFAINPSELFGKSVLSVPTTQQASTAPSLPSWETSQSTHSDSAPALGILMGFKEEITSCWRDSGEGTGSTPQTTGWKEDCPDAVIQETDLRSRQRQSPEAAGRNDWSRDCAVERHIWISACLDLGIHLIGATGSHTRSPHCFPEP